MTPQLMLGSSRTDLKYSSIHPAKRSSLVCYCDVSLQRSGAGRNIMVEVIRAGLSTAHVLQMLAVHVPKHATDVCRLPALDVSLRPTQLARSNAEPRQRQPTTRAMSFTPTGVGLSRAGFAPSGSRSSHTCVCPCRKGRARSPYTTRRRVGCARRRRAPFELARALRRAELSSAPQSTRGLAGLA